MTKKRSKAKPKSKDFGVQPVGWWEFLGILSVVAAVGMIFIILEVQTGIWGWLLLIMPAVYFMMRFQQRKQNGQNKLIFNIFRLSICCFVLLGVAYIVFLFIAAWVLDRDPYFY